MHCEVHSAAAIPVIPAKKILRIFHLHEPMMLVTLEADFGLTHPFGTIAVVAFEVLMRFHQDLSFVPALNANVAPSILDGNGTACRERRLLAKIFIALLSERERRKGQA